MISSLGKQNVKKLEHFLFVFNNDMKSTALTSVVTSCLFVIVTKIRPNLVTSTEIS